MPSAERHTSDAAEQIVPTQFTVRARARRRTALVALNGELDLATISQVTDVLTDLDPRPDGLRHIVLDLRGLTFMDSTGLHMLLDQSERARVNHHNLAVVGGTAPIRRVLKVSGVEKWVVLVDDPDDLVPPHFDD